MLSYLYQIHLETYPTELTVDLLQRQYKELG